MKKIFIILVMAIGLGGMIVFASNIKPEQFSVPTTSTLILPAVTPGTYTDYTIRSTWTNTITFSVGDYVQIIPTNGLIASPDYYWCITGGTNIGTYPTWSKTIDVTNGVAVFRYIHNRDKFTIVNIGASKVSLGLGNAATYGYGITLDSFDLIEKRFNGEVYAVSDSTSTNLVGVQQSK